MIDFKNLISGGLFKSKREIYLLAIFVLLLFLRFVAFKDIKRIKDLSSQRLAKQEELNRKKAEFFSVEGLIKDQQKYDDEYTQTQKTSEILEKKITELKNALIKKEKIANVLNYLTAIADPKEIEFSLISMGPVVEYEKYNELPVKMKLNANYFTFMNYVKELEALPFLIDVRKLELNSEDTNGIVNVKTEIVLYVSK